MKVVKRSEYCVTVDPVDPVEDKPKMVGDIPAGTTFYGRIGGYSHGLFYRFDIGAARLSYAKGAKCTSAFSFSLESKVVDYKAENVTLVLEDS